MRPSPSLNLESFMDQAYRAFDEAEREQPRIFPFEKTFGEEIYMVGEDEDFSRRVDGIIPQVIPKLRETGIVVPHGDVTVVSYVRKAGQLSGAPPPSFLLAGGVWTLDRVRELHAGHGLLENLKMWLEPGKAVREVRQWFAIGRYQAAFAVNAPLVIMMFGYIDFKDDGTICGVCPLAPSAQDILGIKDEKGRRECEMSFGLECAVCMRQVAALPHLGLAKI